MSLTWIDGREVAKKWKENAAQRTQALIRKRRDAAPGGDRGGRQPGEPGLCAQQGKRVHCARGFARLFCACRRAARRRNWKARLLALNADESVHGILVQLPLPKGLDEARVLALIDPEKDVDGFHAMNAGKLMSGQPGFVPCTPLGVMKLLEAYNIPTRGRHAVVIGRSNIVGKPMAMLLLAADATVTVCHSKTENLADITRQADILVAAVGKAEFRDRRHD